MNRLLTLDDFIYICIDEKRGEGYYSLKINGFEICIDKHCSWTISFCNKFEEVLWDKDVSNKDLALYEASKLYYLMHN